MDRSTRLGYQREALYAAYQYKLNYLRSKRGPAAQIVYPNQKLAADRVVHCFTAGNKIVVTLIAKPQVGKTGTFLEIAYKACIHPEDQFTLDPENVFILTGMSDRDWQGQTEGDMLEPFKACVYHRARLNEGLYSRLREARNALIIIDECHIGAEKEQQVSQVLRRLGLLNIDLLKERNIRLLEVSATPGATLYDTQHWGEENHAMVILEEDSSTYVGFQQMLDEERLHSSFDLTKEEEMENLATFVKEKFPEPRWHILRLPAKARSNGEVLDKFRQICAREGWIVSNHNAQDRVGEIDTHLKKAPRSHAFLIIKEFWRASKRLEDSYIGIVHEPATKLPDVNVTAQGLIARLCGNNKRRGSGAPHAFGNVQMIKDYLAWFNVGGDFTKVKSYKSRQLKVTKGKVRAAKDSFAHPSNVGGLEGKAPKKQKDFSLSEFYKNKREVKDDWDMLINWQHEDLKKLSQTSPWIVQTCNANGGTSGQHTHYSFKGTLHTIPTEEEAAKMTDFGRFGGGVRCMPVLNKEGELVYQVIYKEAWLLKSSAAAASAVALHAP